MKTTKKLYRVDNFKSNMGTFEGVFTSLGEAKDVLEYVNEVESADCNFSQITVIETLMEDSQYENFYSLDIDVKMGIWASAEIVDNLYFI